MGDKVRLMDRVVQCLPKSGERRLFSVVKYPTGLDEKLDDLEDTVLLQSHSSNVQFVWIVGLSGVGKTTLVKELIYHRFSDYCGSCFFVAS